MQWTPERVEMLIRLWAEGLSARQIAIKLGGVTRNAVIGKAHRLNLQRGGPVPEPRPEPAPRMRERDPLGTTSRSRRGASPGTSATSVRSTGSTSRFGGVRSSGCSVRTVPARRR